MEPLEVVLLAVAAFVVGTGLGLWLGDRGITARSLLRGRGGRPDPNDLSGSRATSTLGVLDSLVADSIRRLTSWMTPGRDDEPGNGLTLAPDGTLTVLFSDIEDSTALNRRIGDDAFATLLQAHDDHVRSIVRAHDGRVVKTQGDGFMAAFHDPEAAVAAAIELRDDLAEEATIGRSLQLRLGIHTGRAVTEAGDVFGENVAYAARVAQAARGGEVLVSQDVRQRVEGTTADVVFVGRLLPSRLKGLPGWHHLHRADTGA